MPGAETREDVLAASLSTWGMALTEVKEYTAALAKGDDLVAEGKRDLALIHFEVSLDLLGRAYRLQQG